MRRVVGMALFCAACTQSGNAVFASGEGRSGVFRIDQEHPVRRFQTRVTTDPAHIPDGESVFGSQLLRLSWRPVEDDGDVRFLWSECEGETFPSEGFVMLWDNRPVEIGRNTTLDACFQQGDCTSVFCVDLVSSGDEVDVPMELFLETEVMSHQRVLNSDAVVAGAQVVEIVEVPVPDE